MVRVLETLYLQLDNHMKNTKKPMDNYYVYKTGKGQLKLASHYVAGHVLKITAKTPSAAKKAFENYKKLLKQAE